MVKVGDKAEIFWISWVFPSIVPLLVKVVNTPPVLIPYPEVVPPIILPSLVKVEIVEFVEFKTP